MVGCVFPVATGVLRVETESCHVFRRMPPVQVKINQKGKPQANQVRGGWGYHENGHAKVWETWRGIGAQIPAPVGALFGSLKTMNLLANSPIKGDSV